MWSPYLLFSVALFIVFSSESLFSTDPSTHRRTDVTRQRSVDYGTALKMALLLTAVTGVVLYFVLFSTLSPVHDATHQLRHGMAVIPCH